MKARWFTLACLLPHSKSRSWQWGHERALGGVALRQLGTAREPVILWALHDNFDAEICRETHRNNIRRRESP